MVRNGLRIEQVYNFCQCTRLHECTDVEKWIIVPPGNVFIFKTVLKLSEQCVSFLHGRSVGW